MSVYKKHVFVCENLREDGRQCCASGADIPGGAVKFLRQILKAASQHGKGKTRINRAGCFDCCQQGPVLVVYPQGRWYRYDNAADLQEIAAEDILGGGEVKRLRLAEEPAK